MAKKTTDNPANAAKDILSRVGSKRDERSLTSREDIQSFLQAAKQAPRSSSGRNGLVFALDATLSRQHTWDTAQHLQAQMFDAVSKVGNLDIKLAYFRGMGECKASRWVQDTKSLRDLMTGISCRGGQTQIEKLLIHCRKAAAEKANTRPKAMAFVGDAMEENPDTLCIQAGKLGVLGVPVFMFQEGHDPMAEQTFREIARLSGGAYMRFGTGSAAELAELLKAVARFASGGRTALSNTSKEANKLLEQLR